MKHPYIKQERVEKGELPSPPQLVKHEVNTVSTAHIRIPQIPIYKHLLPRPPANSAQSQSIDKEDVEPHVSVRSSLLML